ncbi:MAG: citrate synthase, partial [Oscillospiraceae bacterium]|nr:citrate synthase [Oscillospiraceae bacterium]
MTKKEYFAINENIESLTEKVIKVSNIDPQLYTKYDVKRGLRDLNGKGVLTGLTDISEIRQTKTVDGEEVPTDGRLFYRGYDVNDLIGGFAADDRFGFEETVYLLLFGTLPNSAELEDFKKLLSDYRALPPQFVRDVIMRAPSDDLMNSLARSVLTLFSYDPDPNSLELPKVLRQCLQLIAVFPLLSVYGYQAYSHYRRKKSLYIHTPDPEFSTAESILAMLRPDSKFSELEAKVLDLALILHAEHGGGNNSTFTTHVVTSSGTDTYSAIAAALASLKGPRHGGANMKVTEMFAELKREVKDWSSEDAISEYLAKLLHKEAYDKSGLIYGMGHAVYSISDPRALALKGFVKQLAEEKGLNKEFELYTRVERLAPIVIAKEKKIY